MRMKPKILYVDDEELNLVNFKSAFIDDFEVVQVADFIVFFQRKSCVSELFRFYILKIINFYNILNK